MKYFIMVILMIVNTYAWEINTHRAIDREALKQSENLKKFVKNAGIESKDYGNERS